MAKHTPSAQELLDSLVDHRTEFESVLNGFQHQHYRRGGSPPKYVMAATQVAGQKVILTDGLEKMLTILSNEASDRLELAFAKIAARAMVGDKEMTASEMEHLRKLLPTYIGFLKRYIDVIKSAERKTETHLQTVRAAGADMAKEALSSLGSAKGGGDAHAFVRSIQEGHSRDNQYILDTQQNGLRRATEKLEEMEELLGNLDSAKTNANSSLVAPFPRPPPMRESTADEPIKTVQDILCESTKGPASYYAKLAKLSSGVCVSSESGPGKYVVARIKGPGLCQKLCGFDILQRYNDWFFQLIRYKTAMDRLNLEVRFVGGDGKTYTQTEELIRHDQSQQLDQCITVVEAQLREATNTRDQNHSDIETREVHQREKLTANHRNELSGVRKGNAPRDEDDVTKAAREALEAAHRTSMTTRHQKEVETLEQQLGEYRREQWCELVTLDGLDARLKQLRTDYDANLKYNRRRRAPANSQKRVPCAEL